MNFEDTWHWILAVYLFAEISVWLSKKIIRSMRDRAAAWAEIQRRELRKAERQRRWVYDQAAAGRRDIPERPFIELPKAEPVEKKDPVFRPGIWMQK